MIHEDKKDFLLDILGVISMYSMDLVINIDNHSIDLSDYIASMLTPIPKLRLVKGPDYATD